MALADLTRVCSVLAQLVGAGPDDLSFAPADTTQGKFAPDHIVAAAKLSDIEIARIIQDTIGHGRRGLFMAYSISLTYGQEIPSHSGKIGLVAIQLPSTAGFEPGIPVDIQTLRKLRANADSMYPSAATEGRYFISEEEEVFYIGDDCKVQLPTELTIGSALMSPAEEEPAVIRRALPLLAKNGVDPTVIGIAERWIMVDEDDIRGNRAPRPLMDMFAKSGG